jgi:hypothetical protein
MGGARRATFDRSSHYRYHLLREWDPGLPGVTFVMLNPSTADAEQDDPTIRRCVGFARSWGYGELDVVNLFAYRATSRRDLFAADDPAGPANRRWLRYALHRGRPAVVAWGNQGLTFAEVERPSFERPGLTCLGRTARGAPRHPLYVPMNRVPQPWAI